jgi:organic radical activating enzyme
MLGDPELLREVRTVKTYRIVDVFSTLQGEGSRAGSRAVFVRFTGCNAWSGHPNARDKGKGACSAWCDTAFVHGEPHTVEQLLAKMESLWPRPDITQVPRLCVLTGGEPLLQVDDALLTALVDVGWRVDVETNGSVAPPPLALREHRVRLTVSPKLGLVVCPETLAVADDVKVILPGHVDFAQGWTDGQLYELVARAFVPEFFVQPQDPVDPTQVEVSYLHGDLVFDDRRKQDYQRNLKRCVDFVRANPRWRLSLQLHKLIGLP